MKYLHLFRINNLLLLAAMQVAFRYGFYAWQGITPALLDYQFVLLVLSTMFLAAAGYVVNDIHDRATDSINKPGKNLVGTAIPEASAWQIYAGLNIAGVCLGFFLSYAVDRPWFLLIFMIVVLLLYQYATNLKQSMLTGNLAVAFLAFLSVMILGLFDLYPALTAYNRDILSVVFSILLDFALFAFIITLLREIVKDLEDVDGDYNQGMNTLPIALGVKRTTRIAFWFSLLPAGLVLYYLYEYFFLTGLYITFGYALAFIASPLLYCTIRLRDAQKSRDYKHISLILKLIILAGILAIPLITINRLYA